MGWRATSGRVPWARRTAMSFWRVSAYFPPSPLPVAQAREFTEHLQALSAASAPLSEELHQLEQRPCVIRPPLPLLVECCESLGQPLPSAYMHANNSCRSEELTCRARACVGAPSTAFL